MSWKSFKSAFNSVVSQRSADRRHGRYRAAFRPGLESLEERLAPATYSTNFDLTEFPISEGGQWHNNGTFWTDVKTQNGIAFGTNGPANGYDDSYAYLSGFGPNQQAEAVVFLPGNVSGAPEVELLLHWADGPTSARGYECLFNAQGGVQLVRWNGGLGNFTPLSTTGTHGIGRSLRTGDVVGAKIVGNVISLYINGSQVAQGSDSTWTDGQPGIGFFKRPGYTDLAFTSYTVTDNLATSVPAAPAGLTATAGNAHVSLNWSPSSGATSYNIYRATTSGGEGSTPYRTGITTTSFTDTGLTNGTRYYYQVTAVNSAGQSAKSTEVSATPTANLAPSVVTAAAAAPSVVTGLTTDLSVLGADDGGEANLTYTWAATSAPSGATPTFSANGSSNAAKNSTVTFNKAGTYTFQATIRDTAGLTATSSVNVTVNQTLTSVGVSPVSVSLNNGAAQQFLATARDQFGNPLTTQPAFNWSLAAGSVGTINGSGLYTAPSTGTGSATVRATSGALTGTATVTVTAVTAFSTRINFQPATAPIPVGYLADGGAIFGNRGNGYTYGWNSDISGSARDRNATTDQRYDTLLHMNTAVWEIGVANGSYTVHVVVGDPSYTDVISKLTVEGVLTIDGSTTSANRWLEGTTTVTVSDGRLTIGNLAGSYTKICYIDIAGSGSSNQAPTVATAVGATPSPIAGTTTTLSVFGADDGGEANLIYTWAATALPSGAAPAFSANGTNAAKNATVTFNKAGSYSFQVTIRDAGGLTATSSVSVSVNQTLTSIVLSPSSASVANGGTQQFIATASDQFANPLATQPSFTWSLLAGSVGTVSGAGHYTAPASGNGSATVRAASGAVSGMASVTVTSTAGFSTKINFQPATAPLPAGYLADGGAVFADRGNGLTYGWNSDISGGARDRNATADQRYDTLIHMGSAVWEIAVPNGTYSVYVAVGDPSYADVVSKLTAEGQMILNGATSSTQRWLETTATVTVSDGRLTLANQAGSYNKIDYVDITQVSAQLLAGTPLTGSQAHNLTQKQLGRVVAEAIRAWAATGLSAGQFSALQHVQFVIADLPGSLLGTTGGHVITIDSNAAGYGWSLGHGGVSPHQVDLLTVVSHELGHVLGLSDLDAQTNPGTLMEGTLAPGVRRQP